MWLLVAPLEEAILRGFLMTEIARVVATTPWATVVNVGLALIAVGGDRAIRRSIWRGSS